MSNLNTDLLNRLIATTPIFRNFSMKELVHLLKMSGSADRKQGETIFREGSLEHPAMFIIIEGKIRISISKGLVTPETIATLGVGQCFGEMSIVEKTERSATATVESPTVRLLTLSESTLEQLPPVLVKKVYKNFATTLAERLRNSNKVAAQFSSKEQVEAEKMRQHLKHRLAVDGHLQGADMRQSNFSEIHFENGHFQKGVFVKSNFQGTRFKNCELTHADFTSSRFDGVIFENCSFENANFTAAEMHNTKNVQKGPRKEGTEKDGSKNR